MQEIWLPIADSELHEISNFGRVRSKRCGILKGYEKRQNGKVVCVTVNLGRGKNRRVHHLVLEAFVGPCPDGMEGCHEDGDPRNNRLENLRWDTRLSNQQDSIRHGTKSAPPVHLGEAHHNAALTENDVRAIRLIEEYRGVLVDLAERYSVSHQTIRRVRHRLTWSHVE